MENKWSIFGEVWHSQRSKKAKKAKVKFKRKGNCKEWNRQENGICKESNLQDITIST